MSKEERLVIRTVNKPAREDAKTLTDWFFDSFDLSGKGDLQERAMFEAIVTNSLKGKGTTSKELSQILKLPRSTVIYNLNKFIDSGLIVRKGREYHLRANDFESTIQQLQAEMLMEFNRMMQFAAKLDDLIESELYGEREKEQR